MTALRLAPTRPEAEVASAPRAALFRLEGALSPRPTLTAAAWMALNARRVRARMLGLSSFALAGPLHRRDPGRALRLAWSCLEGMSEDRLIVLGQIYADEHLLNAMDPVGLELLRRCQDTGQRVVIVSDNLDVMVRPVAEHLGVDTVLANQMDLDAQNRATGRLREPVFGPELGGRAFKAALRDRSVELADAAAYGGGWADALLLGAAKLPCAVRPDRELRRIARDLDWPVVDEPTVKGERR